MKELHKMTLEEKFEAAENMSPMWERVTLFSWGDLLGMRDRITALQSQLDALTWTEITPENLPKIGDELFAHHVFRVAQWDTVHVFRVAQWDTVSSVTNIHATWRVDDFLNCGWTHFRPINPPPPSSAKGGDDGKSN